jgi:hypothetical protein
LKLSREDLLLERFIQQIDTRLESDRAGNRMEARVQADQTHKRTSKINALHN